MATQDRNPTQWNANRLANVRSRGPAVPSESSNPLVGRLRAIPKPVKVAIIDDDGAMRRALDRLVNSSGMEAVTFATAGEFLKDPIRDQIDCVITDLRMPGLDGLKLQEELQQALPDLSVVFLTGYGKVSTTVRAMKAGAVDFLEKPVEDETLLAAIARATERTNQSRVARLGLESLRARFGSLTPREREVFSLVTTGLLNKQVGAELGITERTIKVHRARALEKMKANSLADLVRMAQQLGVGSKVAQSVKP